MNIFWLGGVAEREDFNNMLKKGNTQIAANITQLNYIEGLEKVNSKGIKIINNHYEPAFPKYKELFIKKRKWERKGKQNIDIGFINIPVFKYINKTIKMKHEVKKVIKNELEKDELNIFFIYAMTVPLMLMSKFIKKYTKKEKYVICLVVPDLPEFMNMTKQSKIKNILLKVNRKIIYNCIKYIDKFILFAEPMAEYLKIPPKNYLVIEGIANTTIKKKEDPLPKENYIMYAGGINEKYGVLNLVYAFNNIKDTDTELWLYGNGDAVEKIKEIQKKNNKIKYKGIAKNEEIINIEKKAKLLINPRPTNEEYTKYSFPSKNMEYMISGTPVVTTKLPAMPKEYYDYIYVFDDETQEGIEQKLRELLSMPNDQLENKGIKAKEFIIKEKNNITQAKRIINFLGEID